MNSIDISNLMDQLIRISDYSPYFQFVLMNKEKNISDFNCCYVISFVTYWQNDEKHYPQKICNNFIRNFIDFGVYNFSFFLVFYVRQPNARSNQNG